jgi:hypothetical protein
MSRNVPAPPEGGFRPQAWVVLLAVGLAAAVLALGLGQVGSSGPLWVGLRLLALAVAVAAAGVGAGLRLRDASPAPEERWLSALGLGAVAFILFLTFYGLDADWASARLLAAALIGVAVGGAVLVGLPPDPGSAGPWWRSPVAVLTLGLVSCSLAVLMEGRSGPVFALAGLLLSGNALAGFETWWAGPVATFLRVCLLLGGLAGGVAAVAWRLRTATWALPARVRSAVLLVLGGVVAVMASNAMNPGWDSLRLFLVVLLGVALAGALLVVLPTTLRKVVVSLLILVHFGGIATAVLTVAPPGRDPPWLPTVGWAYFYRYYLQFMYLNNAYHFYSPEPGPPTLLWFAVRYEGEDKPEWIKIPERSKFRTREEYQRRLSVTENANVNMLGPGVPPEVFEDMLHRRALAGNALDMPKPSPEEYREPTIYSKKLMESYARHVARHYHSEKNPSVPVVSIKIYRVTHKILEPYQMGAGFAPDHPTTYLPFFMGEFDRDGHLKHPDDPFLYWYVPIIPLRKDGSGPPPDLALHPEEYAGVRDYTQIHAALKD